MVDIFNEYRLQKIKDYLRHIPEFYKEILKTWSKMGVSHAKTQSHFFKDQKTAHMGK